MAEKDDGFEKELWIYAGRRLLSDNKLAACFVGPDGEEMLYGMGKGVKHRAIGATYEVEVKREGERATARIADATFVDAAAESDARVGEWEARDRAAFTTDMVRKAEDKARKDTSAWENMTLDELRRAYMRLPWGQQTAMIAQVIRYLQMSRV